MLFFKSPRSAESTAFSEERLRSVRTVVHAKACTLSLFQVHDKTSRFNLLYISGDIARASWMSLLPRMF